MSVTATDTPGTAAGHVSSAVEGSALTGREEAWRFTPLARLRGLHASIESPVAPGIAVDAAPEARHEVVPTASLPAAVGPVEGPALELGTGPAQVAGDEHAALDAIVQSRTWLGHLAADPANRSKTSAGSSEIL